MPAAPRFFRLLFVAASVCSLVPALAIANQAITPTIQASHEGPQCLDRDARAGEPKSYCGLLPSLAALNICEATLEERVRKLKRPWSIEFIDDNTILIGELSGRFKLYDVRTNKVTSIKGGPELPPLKGQIGMQDIALPSDFATSGEVFFSHTTGSDGALATAISKGILKGKTLTGITQIYVARPAFKTTGNFGGALMFDENDLLYAAIGDSARHGQVQKTTTSLGKILRLNRDGSIPKDNPFVGNDQYLPEIYALGVRNPQGLTQDPETGLIYEAEHGPMGGDEVNLILEGENYGWSTAGYGMGYTYKQIARGTSAPGMRDPLFYYMPSRAISPIAVYRGDKFPEFDGDLLVGALRGRSVSRLDLKDGRILSESKILWEVDGRVRDIKVASDGSVWMITDDGRLLRLDRQPVDSVRGQNIATHRGKEIYDLVCASCHTTKVSGAPKLTRPEQWRARLKKGYDKLYNNTLDGIGGMPPRGLCEDCSDDELRQALDYIVRTVSESQ